MVLSKLIFLFFCYLPAISDLKLEDTGLYECVASSRSGKYVWRAYLHVEPANSIHYLQHSQQQQQQALAFPRSSALDIANIQRPRPPMQPRIIKVDSSSVTIAWNPRYWESVESPEGSLSASGVGNGGGDGASTNSQSSATSSIISSEVSIGHDVVNMGSNGLSNSFVHGSESGSNSNTATNGDGKNGIDSSAASGRNGLPSLLKGRKNKVKSFSDEDDDDNMGEDDDDEDWRGGRKEINRGGMDEDDSYDDDDDLMLDDQGGEGEENDDIENDWHWTVAAAGDILDNLGSHLTDEFGKNGKKRGHSRSGSTNSRKKRQSSILSRSVVSKKSAVDKMQKDAALQESSIAKMESDEEIPRSSGRNPSSFLFSGGKSHLEDRAGNGDGDERESVKHISLEQIDRGGNIKKGKFGDNDDEDFVELDERKNGNNHNNNNSKGKGMASVPSSTTRVPRVSPPTSVRSASSMVLLSSNNKKDSGVPSSSALSSGVKKSTLITYKVEYYSADEVRSEWLLGATDVSLEMFSLQYLKPNTEYVFFVRAVSPEGVVSAPSPLSESVTTHISTSNRNSDDLDMAREKLGQGIVVLLKNAYPTSSTSIKIEWQVRIVGERDKKSYYYHITQDISIIINILRKSWRKTSQKESEANIFYPLISSSLHHLPFCPTVS